MITWTAVCTTNILPNEAIWVLGWFLFLINLLLKITLWNHERYTDGFMQNCGMSIADAMEMAQPCAKLLVSLPTITLEHYIRDNLSLLIPSMVHYVWSWHAVPTPLLPSHSCWWIESTPGLFMHWESTWCQLCHWESSWCQLCHH